MDTRDYMAAALERQEWDLVLCDHSMPAFSSSAALGLLQEKGFHDLPFIIVSGRIGEDAAVAAMRSGAHDYIMKDNLTRLNSAIERELREAEVRRERRRAEESLVNSERSLAAAQRIARLGNFDYHTESDEAFWSDELFRVCGLDPRRFVPTYRSFLRAVHPEDRDVVRKTVREALYDKAENTVEYRIVRPDGEARFVQTFYEVHRNPDGKAVRLTGTVQDVTERKRTEEARRRAEEKYRLIFENSVEGIFQTTADGRMITANPAMARIFGYSSPEDLMDSVADVATQLYAETARREQLAERLRREGSVTGFEAEIVRKDGTRGWISESARAVRDASGEMIGLEGNIEDITERKRAEENLREMREAERRRIARDLHDEALQDLVYALQSTQVLKWAVMKSGVDPVERLEELAETLKRAVGGLRTALYDLRVESEAGRSLPKSLEALVEMHRRLSPERHFELRVLSDEEEFSRRLPEADRVDLLRIIQEALTNVRRHSGAHRAEVRVGLDAACVWAEVSDDGRGFDPGTEPGMGLTGMRERASALGGRVEVRNENGTTIRFETVRPPGG